MISTLHRKLRSRRTESNDFSFSLQRTFGEIRIACGRSTSYDGEMSHRLRFTAVWIAVASLLMQSVYPASVFGCDCHSAQRNDSTSHDSCCCSGDSATRTTGHCPRCEQASGAKQKSGEPEDTRCPCGDIAPVYPVSPILTGEFDSAFEFDTEVITGRCDELISEELACSTTARIRTCSCEELRHHFKQVVLCVWLT